MTALYELIPTDAPAAQNGVPLKYAQTAEKSYSDRDEMLTLKLRYKEPEGSTSKLLTSPLMAEALNGLMDESFRWATTVAAFGQYLRQSDALVLYGLDDILKPGESAMGEDASGYRRELIQLIQKAKQLESGTTTESPYPQWQYRN